MSIRVHPNCIHRTLRTHYLIFKNLPLARMSLRNHKFTHFALSIEIHKRHTSAKSIAKKMRNHEMNANFSYCITIDFDAMNVIVQRLVASKLRKVKIVACSTHHQRHHLQYCVADASSVGREKLCNISKRAISLLARKTKLVSVKFMNFSQKFVHNIEVDES